MMIYVIMDVASISIAHVNVSTSNKLSDTRINLGGDKAILKFKNDDNVARNIFINEKWYMKKEIIDDILSSQGWE